VTKLKLLDTFAGIGGFSYAAEKIVGGFETTKFIEINPFSQKILKKHWPNIPIHDDITTFTARPFQYDVISAGFPCQDISVAGLQKGITKESRSGLFYELMRVVRMVRPKFIVLENVAAILNNGLDIVLGELSEAGYDAEWSIISASSLGACHQRSRWWLVAYPNNNGHQRGEFETCNKVTPRQDTQIIRPTNTSNFERCSNDGEDKGKSRTFRNLSKSSNGGKAISTETGRVCNLSKTTDNNKRISNQNNYQENNDRTLVSEGQKRFQLSLDRELVRDQTIPQNNKIRHGDDNCSDKRMDNKKSNITNSDSERLQRRIMEIGQELQTQNNFRKENSFRSKSFQSVSNTTNTNSFRTQSNCKRLESSIWENAFLNSKKRRTLDPDWRRYVSQPCLRRGDDGLRGRVDRLKALGNSVVPQVAAIPLQRVHDLYYNE
tara:strand:+ start:199 stop:1503 length:1305 start_codon:yes stop_codon:yes gene_type:complete